MTNKNRKIKVNSGFNRFMRSRLSYDDYVNLPKHLKRTRKSTTMLLKDPKIGTVQDLETIHKLICKWDSNYKMDALINNYGFGKQN